MVKVLYLCSSSICTFAYSFFLPKSKCYLSLSGYILYLVIRCVYVFLFNLKDTRPILLNLCLRISWEDCRTNGPAAAQASEMQRKVSLLFFHSVFFFHLFLLTSIEIKVLTNNCHVANTCNYVAMFATLQTFFKNPFLGVMQIFEKAHLFLLFSSFVLKNEISICRKSMKICHKFTIKAQKRVPCIYFKRLLFFF